MGFGRGAARPGVACFTRKYGSRDERDETACNRMFRRDGVTKVTAGASPHFVRNGSVAPACTHCSSSATKTETERTEQARAYLYIVSATLSGFLGLAQ